MHITEATPQAVAQHLCDIAHTPELMRFVCNAIDIYFDRIFRASHEKLARHGLRPVIAPMVAEAALLRVERVEYSEAYVHAVIAGDADAAALAERAVRFYAHRYAGMDIEGVLVEVGGEAPHVKAAANVLALSLDCILVEE